jgi:hypothetical protein
LQGSQGKTTDDFNSIEAIKSPHSDYLKYFLILACYLRLGLPSGLRLSGIKKICK